MVVCQVTEGIRNFYTEGIQLNYKLFAYSIRVMMRKPEIFYRKGLLRYLKT
jgi:hypothetical protein